METVLILCRFLHFAAVMLLAGGTVLFPALAGRDAVPPAWPKVQAGLAALAVASALGWLMMLSGLFAADWHAVADPAALASVLTETEFGRLWLARFAVAAMLFALLPFRRALSEIVAALTLLLLGSLALTGHAIREDGAIGVLHRLNQLIHLLAGGAWLGGIGVLLWLVSARRKAVEAAFLERALGRFSGIGVGAVLLILGSGIANDFFVMDKPSSFSNTSYGQVLLVKMVLVLGMIVAALTNRFVLMPRLVRAPGPTRRRLLWSLGAELLLGAAVLAAVSLLGTLMPPSDGMG